MKRMLFGCLSVLLIGAATAPAVKAEPTAVNFSNLQNTSTSLAQLTPFQIVSLAYSGAFQKQGIPSYGALRQAVAGGQVTAKDLVQSAVNAHKLSAEILTNQGYMEAVENQLHRLAPSAPEF